MMDEDGVITLIDVEGTEGTECVDLTAALKRGLKIEEEIPKPEMDSEGVQVGVMNYQSY